MKNQKISKRAIVAIVAAVMFFVGFTMASVASTAGGSVKVTRINYITEEGIEMSAKMYVPENATAETPAPGILAVPGGNASLENLSAIAIELSRRGYVVMAIDPYTIGRSEVVNTSDVGAGAALDYLMTLDYVDSDNIGAVGHSAGTGRVQKAVQVDPDSEDGTIKDGVKAVMYLGAGSFNLENVNLGVFIGSWDNTYGSGVTSTRDLTTDESFTAALGLDEIELNTWYGDVSDGTARILYSGNSGHATALLLKEPIMDVVKFFDTALMTAPITCTGTIYLWKELGTGLGLIAVIMMMFPLISWLVDRRFFQSIKRPIPSAVSGINAPFLFYFIMPAIINTLICKWAIYTGQQVLANINFIFPINNTNGFIFWFGCSALLSLLILAIRFKWDKGIDRERIITHAKTTVPNFFKSLLLGLIVIGMVYAFTYLAEIFWGLSPRLWKVQINVLNSTRLNMFIRYFIPYLLFFGVFNFSQTIGLRVQGHENKFTFLVWLSSTIPAAAFLIYAYGKLFITGYTAITNVQMSRANSTLLNCILTYFITCKVTTFCYKKTGGYHTGAVINALIMTWTAVATDLITQIV